MGARGLRDQPHAGSPALSEAWSVDRAAWARLCPAVWRLGLLLLPSRRWVPGGWGLGVAGGLGGLAAYGESSSWMSLWNCSRCS